MDDITNAAAKLLRAVSGLQASLSSTYDLRRAAQYVAVINRLLQAHLIYRGLNAIQVTADKHYTGVEVLDAADDYLAVVGSAPAPAEQAILRAIHATAYEMYEKLCEEE